MASEPKLLRIPQHFHSVDELLAVAGKLGLSNALLISETEDGAIIFLDSDLTFAQANWLLDRLKVVMLQSR